MLRRLGSAAASSSRATSRRSGDCRDSIDASIRVYIFARLSRPESPAAGLPEARVWSPATSHCCGGCSDVCSVSPTPLAPARRQTGGNPFAHPGIGFPVVVAGLTARRSCAFARARAGTHRVGIRRGSRLGRSDGRSWPPGLIPVGQGPRRAARADDSRGSLRVPVELHDRSQDHEAVDVRAQGLRGGPGQRLRDGAAPEAPPVTVRPVCRSGRYAPPAAMSYCR